MDNIIPRPAEDEAPPQPKPTTNADRLLTVLELAKRWGVTRAHIYALMERDGLPSVSIGRCRRFRPAEVDHWLDRQADPGPSAA